MTVDWEAWKAGLAWPDDRVVIAYLHPGHVEHCFAESLLNTYQLDHQKGVGRLVGEQWRIGARCGGSVVPVRNNVVRKFFELDHRPEWLWMVDTDMEWQPDALERLLVHARPDRIVGGLCFAADADGNPHPTLFNWDEQGRQVQAPKGSPIPQSTLLQVAGTGGAFLLVHREALTRIVELEPFSMTSCFREVEVLYPNPEYDPAATEGIAAFEVLPHSMSEDLFFCHQAHKAGLTVWVDTGVEVGHSKQHILDRALYESWHSRRLYESWHA